MDADPYALLGIRRDAGAAEIRRAYRALAARFHPDRDPGPEARERFRRISEAYGVLSDSAKREAYDRTTAAARGVPRPGQWVRVHPRPKKASRPEMAADFRRAMKPGTVFVVRAGGARVGPVPLVAPDRTAMPEVPLWTGRRG